MLWVGLIQSVEGLKRTKDWYPQARQNFYSGQPSDLNCNIGSSCISSLPAYPVDFGLANLPNHTIQFLKINLSIYTPPTGFVSSENPYVHLSYAHKKDVEELRKANRLNWVNCTGKLQTELGELATQGMVELQTIQQKHWRQTWQRPTYSGTKRSHI